MKLTKILICTIIFLTLGILGKKDIKLQKYIQNKLYNETISFSFFDNIYQKYLGGIIPIEETTSPKTILVSNNPLIYKDIEEYEKGVKLQVGTNYIVQSQTEGIIVYIGEKEKYKNTIIIEDVNNKNTWYGNICNSTFKLYDRIKKGDILGESCDNYIYLVYTKDNEFLNYKNYIE